MSLDNYTDFKLPKNAYLSFDANSLKELIIDRLSEDGTFTDQNFEGSNFSAVIDVVAYMYHVLLFYLNTTSNESTFSTATIYENMNKLVSNIGYKPVGDQTSILNIDMIATGLNTNIYTIPRFSLINVGSVSYYTLRDITFQKVVKNAQETLEVDYDILHQGQMREASFIATGEDYETITLIDEYTTPQINKSAPTANDEKFIADNTFSVYVQDSTTGSWSEWSETSSLFLLGPNNKSYEKRLNSEGNYEFKFGNGNNGLSLSESDNVVIFYLVSDNVQGVLGASATDGKSFVLYSSVNFDKIRSGLYNDSEFNLITNELIDKIRVNNEFSSTPVKVAETVDEIRDLAPKIFATQNRLVSKTDYESHINRTFSNITRPVKVLSNDDYTSQVLFYYNQIGVKRGVDDARTLLAQVNFSSSTNFNNIYVYTVRTDQAVIDEKIPNYLNEGQKRQIVSYCDRKKDVTHNVIIADPIFKAFSFGVGELTDDNTVDEIVRDSQLRITVDRNIAVSDESIRSKIRKIFKESFEALNLGDIVNVSEMSRSILNIDGVEGIETVNGDNVSANLSFVIWNPDYRYIDSLVLAREYNLKSFEYAYFYNVSELGNKITIRRV